jgi:hypothetical protein
MGSSLVNAGFSVETRHTGPLSAGESTLTWVLAEAGFESLQLEVARRCRLGVEDPETMTRLIAALADGAVSTARHR